MHTLQGIVYTVLKKQGDLITLPKEIRMHLTKSYKTTAMWTITQEYEIEQVLKSLRENNIVHVLFKGWQLREYYPIKELRTMGDIDILVKPEDRERAIACIEEADFVFREGGAQVSNFRKKVVEIELHTDISAGMSFRGDECRKYFENAMEHTVAGDGEFTRYFQVDYHFIFLLFHLAKHFSYLGAGIRMFVDITIYINAFAEQMNWEYIEEELKKLHLYDFYENVLYLCRTWLGLQIHTDNLTMDPELYGKLCEYVFKGGIFGYAERDESTFRLRRGVRADGKGSGTAARFRAWIGHLFPGKEYMAKYLPAVEKHAYLLPAAWIMRGFVGIFRHKDTTLRNMMDYTGDVDKASRQQRLLREVGL